MKIHVLGYIAIAVLAITSLAINVPVFVECYDSPGRLMRNWYGMWECVK